MNLQLCFKILKLGRNASIEEAKHSHRKLAYIWHPDRHSDKILLMRKRAERKMQKINIAYETVRSFLSSQQQQAAETEVQAKAKAAAETKAAAAARTKASHRRIGVRKFIFAVSSLVLCSLLIIFFINRDQTLSTSKYSENSRPNPNDANVDNNRGKGQGEMGPSSSISPLVKDAVASPRGKGQGEMGPSSSISPPAKDAVASPKGPESPKLESGMVAFKVKSFAEAVALFEEILASDPSIINKVSGPYARALRGQSSNLVKTDPQKAKALLLTSVELEPESVQGHFQLGLLYVRLKDYTKAIDTYQKAAALDPQFSEIFFNLAYVYAVTKDFSKAKEMYVRVVELAPPFLDEALFNLAIVHEKLGKRDKSIKNLEQAIMVNPENELAKKYLQRLKRK
jgi:tetratricopeptide (TPR) repeat protein